MTANDMPTHQRPDEDPVEDSVDEPVEEPRRRQRVRVAPLVAGIVFLAMAIAFAVADLDSLDAQLRVVWPIAMVAIGLGLLFGSRRGD